MAQAAREEGEACGGNLRKNIGLNVGREQWGTKRGLHQMGVHSGGARAKTSSGIVLPLLLRPCSEAAQHTSGPGSVLDP